MTHSHRITVLPGDGIGPEIMEALMIVLESTGLKFVPETFLDFGARAGGELPKDVITSILRTGVAIKGPTATPLGEGHRSLNVQLREEFDLFANVRPVQTVPGVRTRYSDTPISLIVFRENLEDLYIGDESAIGGGYEAKSRITAVECERFARFAFSAAAMQGRHKMTIVHKANILKKTHGMFRDIAYAVAADFPAIECDDLIADNCFMQLVMRPERFDCLLLPNFLGDLASDICAGLVGGLGFAPGANMGNHGAIFEAVHGTAPDIAGKGIANPTSLILSGAMMLDYLGEKLSADIVRFATYAAIEAGKSTGDAPRVNGEKPLGTIAFAEEVAGCIRAANKAFAA